MQQVFSKSINNDFINNNEGNNLTLNGTLFVGALWIKLVNVVLYKGFKPHLANTYTKYIINHFFFNFYKLFYFILYLLTLKIEANSLFCLLLSH